MLTFDIPGYRKIGIQHLVCDFNGTIALDGRLIEGVAVLMETLAEQLEFHVITADTFGSVEKEIAHLPCKLTVIPLERQAEHKLSYTTGLGLARTACIGNGRNDCLMIKAAALGIGLMQAEGMAGDLLAAADIVCPDVVAAFQLFQEPKRLIATLRR